MSEEELEDKYKGLRKVVRPPEMEKEPDKCDDCDRAIVMGLMTGRCQTLPEEAQKRSCWSGVEPVSNAEASPVDALANVFVEEGTEKLDEMVERSNWLIFQATQKAHDRLVNEGKIKPEK